MCIKPKDIKKLWGLSAGRCSYPGCGEVCIKFIDQSNPTVVGEMAHIIAKNPGGARFEPAGGDCNTYENLILLCPNHHTLVDKGPVDKFSPQLLRSWKKQHEDSVSQALITSSFKGKKELCKHIAGILNENKSIWSRFGPDSEVAKNNPLNTAAMIWALRKLDTIVPNNRKIITMLDRNAGLFSSRENDICSEFVNHTKTFELNAYQRQDSDAVPRFPVCFEKMILENAHDV